MKLVTKIAAGILLGIGLPISLYAVSTALNSKTIPQDREGAIDVLIILGLPPLALGSWLIVGGFRRSQRAAQEQLQTTFFKLIKQNDGCITPLSFAMETGVSGDIAKQYLDQKAKEFSANFDVDSHGNMFYLFGISAGVKNPAQLSTNEISLPPPANQSVAPPVGSMPPAPFQGGFDVILEAVPNRSKISAIKVVRELTGMGLKEAKELVESLPTKVQVETDELTAQKWQRRLAAIGATVIVMPR